MMHEESIYNLIPREEYKPPKPAKRHDTFAKQRNRGNTEVLFKPNPVIWNRGRRHESKFKSQVREETKTNKAGYKTMGQAKVPTRGPSEFMRKHERDPGLPQKEQFSYPDAERSKPAVPKPNEKPVMGVRTTKNFITNNAVQNIMSVPKQPKKNFVDTKKGDKQFLEPSGMEPKFINKKDYGKTPAYLAKRADEVRRAQDDYDAYISEHFRRGAMQSLTVADRTMLLDGLKSNWEELHHQYQGLSVVTDTAPKKNRKERMEAEMKQLEKDIETIEKHRVIYIAN